MHSDFNDESESESILQLQYVFSETEELYPRGIVIKPCEFNEGNFMSCLSTIRDISKDSIRINFSSSVIHQATYESDFGFTFTIDPLDTNESEMLFYTRMISVIAKMDTSISTTIDFRNLSSRFNTIAKIIELSGINIILHVINSSIKELIDLVSLIKNSIKGLICTNVEARILIENDVVYTSDIKYLEIHRDIRGYPERVQYAPLIRKLYHLETLSIDDEFDNSQEIANFRDTISALRNTQIDNLEFSGSVPVDELMNLPYLEYFSCWYSPGIFQRIYNKVMVFKPIALGHFERIVIDVRELVFNRNCMVDTIIGYDEIADNNDVQEILLRRRTMHQRIKDMHISRGARTMLYGFMYGGRGSLMFIHSISPVLAELIASYI